MGLESVLDAGIGGTKDPRAFMQAIRTALQYGGLMEPAGMGPVRKVSELSVPELSELIASTERELAERISRRLPDGKA